MSTIKSTSPDNEPLSHDGNDPINASELLPPDNFASKVKGKKGLARLLKATGYSIEGFKAAYKFEAAFRQVVWLNLALLMVITLIPFGVASKMLLVTASFYLLLLSLSIQLLKRVSTIRQPNSIRWPK